MFRRFRQRHPRFFRGVSLAVCFLASFGVGFAYASWALVCRAERCPSVKGLGAYQPRQASKIFAIDGRYVGELGAERRTVVRINDIPPIVRNAFVVMEDKRFYSHSGIDWRRVPSALLIDIRKRSWREGFSTITMQLARNIFPDRISREKTIVRKIKEAKVARAIEATYSKDKILELYLNQIYLGNGAYGVESASRRYFGKSTRDLTIAQAATLAALPKGPDRYNPRRFPQRVLTRRNVVIRQMLAAKLITRAQADSARAEPLGLTPPGDTAPYFVEWVRQQLNDRFGSKIYDQGLRIFTTLDVDLQAAAEHALEGQIRAIEAGRYGAYRHETYQSYTADAGDDDEREGSSSSPYLQGMFIAIDPHTGGVRALIGGRDFDDNKYDRAVQALRQPGSTFKPIVVAEAVHKGRPLSYLLDDSPLRMALSPTSTWAPKDFQGNYVGPITIRRALADSRNVPFVRLGMELGAQNVVNMARALGVSTPIPRYPSIVLGSAEVYPIEMVAAYTAFATLGTRVKPMAIVRVENAKGEILWEPTPTFTKVLDADEAWLVVDAMKNVITDGTAASSVGARFHAPAAGKTGTTNDAADVWFIGFTPDLVAGVWMGFDRPQQIMPDAEGGILAAPAWTSFMNDAYRTRSFPVDWLVPPSIITRKIDFATNSLAASSCAHSLVGIEYFIPGTEPTHDCTVRVTPAKPAPPTAVPVRPKVRLPQSNVTQPPARIDTTARGTVNMPPESTRTRDSSHRTRDSVIFSPTRNDSTSSRDSTNLRPPPQTQDSTRPPSSDSSKVKTRPDSMTRPKPSTPDSSNRRP